MRYTQTMKRTITQRELRNDSGAVLREVQAGNTLIVTRNGEPVAELRPIPRRTFVARQVIAAVRAVSSQVDYKRFQKDIDRTVDQSVTAEHPTDE